LDANESNAVIFFQYDMRATTFIQKYRVQDPTTLPEGAQKLIEVARQGEVHALPNLLLYGPPGTGKNSCFRLLAHLLFPDSGDYERNVHLINASEERKIEDVRSKIKTESKCMRVKKVNGRNIEVPGIICLDEADSLTKDAQHALRRPFETSQRTTRFIIMCNDVRKIIDAIQSRCQKIFFPPLPNPLLEKVIAQVCVKEGLKIEKPALTLLCTMSHGDARMCLNWLSQAAMTSEEDGKISEELVTMITRALSKKELDLLDDDNDAADKTWIAREWFRRNVDLQELMHTMLDRVMESKSRDPSSLAVKLADIDYKMRINVPRDLLFYQVCEVWWPSSSS
jgi:DNA polymerase III delta prime subunit